MGNLQRTYTAACNYLTVCLQLAVTVHDSAIPNVRTTSTLTITVTRNQNPPRFTEDVYTANLNIQTKVGDPVITIRATDADGVRGLFLHSHSCVTLLLEAYQLDG